MDISRASTFTIGREDSFVHGHLLPIDGDVNNAVQEQVLPEEVPDYLLEDLDADPEAHAKRLIIAADFGTTYSAVSYVALDEGDPAQHLDTNRIKSIQNFPDDWDVGQSGDGMKSEVPTEVMYPLDRSFRKKEQLGDSREREEQQHGPEGAAEALAFPGEYLAAQAAGFDGCGGNGLAVFGQPASSEDDDRMSIDDDPSSFRWGYGVHEAWGLHATPADPRNQALSRFKLLLDESQKTLGIRTRLVQTLDALKERKVISNHREVIDDFLTCLLRHTKSELSNAGLDESYRMEIVLCVPAIWSQKACRDMQTALAIAMERARFGGVNCQHSSIENLFIVSEPEAAAAFVLAQNNAQDVAPGDTFVLLDAGGGTVDANTYTVSATTPLRLTREVVPPRGGLYGSSYLNEAFSELVRELLVDEVYLEEGGNSINGCVESILNYFEYRVKRHFDCYTARGYKTFNVLGLRDNAEKNFTRGRMLIPVDRIQAIFLRCLDGIASLMEEQIRQALAIGATVEKVILIGGFAGSISLKKFLQNRLAQFCRDHNCHASLIVSNCCATAVASGAVLRAFDKENGPRRYARSSYGILRTEPQGDFEEHRGVKPYYDRHDGQPYVFNTIYWVLKLGQEVESVWMCRPFLCSHMFPYWPPAPLICKEVLYVSDSATESHYKVTHEKNRGAEVVGEIIADFTFLRDQGLILPVDGGVNSSGRRVGRKHYQVNYTMVIKVVDRDLQCFAYYKGQVRQKCRLNIAAAFRPGVK